MKIVDQRGTSTRFDDADVGDYFYEVDERDSKRLYLKVPVQKDGAKVVNMVCLGTGDLAAFKADELVQVVEVTIFVTSNTPERPA